MSREIDALVAEKVMDWKWMSTVSSDNALAVLVGPGENPLGARVWVEAKPETPRASDGLRWVPAYSTDLNACFEAQAKCIEKVGWEEYTVELLCFCVGRSAINATAEQRCLAMLACLGVKVPE